MLKTQQSIFNVNLLFGFVLIVSPWLVLLLGSFFTGHSITNLVPVWSDELEYWHEVLSLSQKGLNHGYYTYNEVIPAFSTFGPHGFGVVSVYALFAKVFGWKVYSIVVANAFFMSLAFLFLILILKPTVKQITFIILLTITFVPFLLFSTTSMSEGLNYALIAIYFALIYRFIQRGEKKLLLALIAVCTVFSLIRIIYIILFLPILFIRNREFMFDRKLLLFISIWLIFSVVLFVINGLFVSPFPDSFLHELFTTNGIIGKTELFFSHFFQNIIKFINPLSDNILQTAGRYILLIVLFYSLIKSGTFQFKPKKIRIDFFVVNLILFFVLIITFAAYDVFDWRDYRVFAPVLYGCMLFLIFNSNKFELYSLLVINVLVLVVSLLKPQIWESFNEGRLSPITENVLLRKIEFIDNPTNNFDNTLVVQSFNQNMVLNVPAGIGISVVDSLSDGLKSKYIFSAKELNLKTHKLLYSDKSGYLYKIN